MAMKITNIAEHGMHIASKNVKGATAQVAKINGNKNNGTIISQFFWASGIENGIIPAQMQMNDSTCSDRNISAG